MIFLTWNSLNKDIHMQSLLYFIILLICPLSLIAQPLVAVVNLDARRISEFEANALSDRLRIELFKTKAMVVVERDKMEEILREQGVQLTGCTSSDCLVKIGHLLSVEQMVGGSVIKVGNTYSVAVRLISMETGKIIRVSTYDHEGMIDRLLTSGMRTIAQEITGIESEIP